MESDEYSTSRVPQNRSVAWWRIAVINVLFSFSLPSLVAGMDLANGTPSTRLITGILAGNAILTVISILTSIVGALSRLSSYLLARLAFGTRGSMLNNDKIIQRPNIAAVEYGMRVRPRTVGLSAGYRF